MCTHEIAGGTKDVIIPLDKGASHKEPSRDCSILHGENSKQKKEIEDKANELGVSVIGRRCPFYGNKTCQQECPYFS